MMAPVLVFCAISWRVCLLSVKMYNARGFSLGSGREGERERGGREIRQDACKFVVIVYRIAGKFGGEFNLAVFAIGASAAKFNSGQILHPLKFCWLSFNR